MHNLAHSYTLNAVSKDILDYAHACNHTLRNVVRMHACPYSLHESGRMDVWLDSATVHLKMAADHTNPSVRSYAVKCVPKLVQEAFIFVSEDLQAASREEKKVKKAATKESKKKLLNVFFALHKCEHMDTKKSILEGMLKVLKALSSELDDGWMMVLTLLKSIAGETDPEQVCVSFCLFVPQRAHCERSVAILLSLRTSPSFSFALQPSISSS